MVKKVRWPSHKSFVPKFTQKFFLRGAEISARPGAFFGNRLTIAFPSDIKLITKPMSWQLFYNRILHHLFIHKVQQLHKKRICFKLKFNKNKFRIISASL